MASYFRDNEDLLFYFDRAVDWEPLVRATEYAGLEGSGFADTREAVAFYREVADMVGTLAADEVAPNAAALDRAGASLVGGEGKLTARTDEIFRTLKDAELHRLNIPRELGGMNAPLLLYFANSEVLARADVSVMAHHGFHGGMAMAMLAFSLREGSTDIDRASRKINKTRFDGPIGEIIRGEAWGCMDITEPDAGSDMAALRTRGELTDGKWLVTGQKIFITSGHGKWHFVIARTEETKGDDPLAGLAGLSMFLVKTYEDRPDGSRDRWVTIDRLEEKLGHHGSVTASLSFDRAPAELIGKRGEGFQYMLTLMNGARLGVGFESIGLAEAAVRMAEAYAAGRRSMGKPIARHEMIADYLEEMRTDVQGLRALAFHAAWEEEMAQKLQMTAGFATDAERARLQADLPVHRARARRATPLLKYLAAEKAVELARRNLQIHGGVGYTMDYGAERLLRDALVMPIYEGTSQIQALMAMKDTLGGVIKRPQQFLANLADARWRSLSVRDPLERGAAHVSWLSHAAQQHLVTRTAVGKLRSLRGTPVEGWKRELTKSWDPKRDFSLAMLHAERLTRLLADELVLELLVQQARRFPERRDLLERWLERAEPRAKMLHDEITSRGARFLATLEPTAHEPATVAAE